MQHVIIYMKVNENKKEGLVFDGPFYGPIAHSESSAKVEAKKITNARGGMVITKIYKIADNISFMEAMIIAKPIFIRIKRNIIEAKEIADRPRIKKSKT